LKKKNLDPIRKRMCEGGREGGREGKMEGRKERRREGEGWELGRRLPCSLWSESQTTICGKKRGRGRGREGGVEGVG